MKLQPVLVALVAVGFTATPLCGVPGKSGSKAQASLFRPSDGVDANAKGRVDAFSRKMKDRLIIKAKRLDEGLEVNFLIEDDGGALQPVN